MNVLELRYKFDVDIEFCGDGVDNFDYGIVFKSDTEETQDTMCVTSLHDLAEGLEEAAKKIRETIEIDY